MLAVTANGAQPSRELRENCGAIVSASIHNIRSTVSSVHLVAEEAGFLIFNFIEYVPTVLKITLIISVPFNTPVVKVQPVLGVIFQFLLKTVLQLVAPET